MDIRISFKKTRKGTTLATARIRNDDEVLFHRANIPDEVEPWDVFYDVASAAVQRLRSAVGPERMVTMQMPLPLNG